MARCGELPSLFLHYTQAVVVSFDMDGVCSLADCGTCVWRRHGVSGTSHAKYVERSGKAPVGDGL